MADTAYFFVKTDVGIGQLAMEMGCACLVDSIFIDSVGALLNVRFSRSIDRSIGRGEVASIDISPTELRFYGYPGMNEGTAMEFFDYKLEVEFDWEDRDPERNYNGETGWLGRALYDRFRQYSCVLRPMVYVVDEETKIAAVSLPGRETRTVDPAAFIRDAALCEELGSVEVREFRESPVPVVPEGEALCLLRATDKYVYIQPLIFDASREPAPPSVVVDLKSGIEPVLGEACAAALWHSSTATTEETVHYEESEVDSLGMSSQQLILQAHADAGRLVLSVIEQLPGDASASHYPDVEVDCLAPESYERLGALLISALTETSGSNATG